jgi:Hsp90 protein
MTAPGRRMTLARMREGQEDIYYLLAPSLAAAKSSPHLEAFRTKGGEVLLLGEGVDNWVVSSLREFDGKKLQSVAQGDGNLGALADEAEKQEKEQADAEYAELLGKLKANLVRASLGRACVYPAHHFACQAVLTLGARIDDPTTLVKQLDSLLTALTEDEVTEEPATGEDGEDREPGDGPDQ